MKMLPRLLRLSSLLFAALTLARAADIDGAWSAEFDTQVGPQKYTYHLTADGEKLTGAADWERMGEKGSTPLVAGKISGNTVSFSEKIAAQGMEIQIAYTGALQGDELKLKRVVGDFATEEFVAKRVAPAPTPAAAAVEPKPAHPPIAFLAPRPTDAEKLAAATPIKIADGPFQPTWDSLAKNNHTPDWFRDAKFGIWAHWSAQCVPERGDWYARNMYIQGTETYNFHVAHYGHPSKFGFMEFDHLWTAEKWEPEKMMALYRRAGAKYFFALANHHDNFDTYDSKYQPWNSTRVGPMKDIVGTWAKAARAAGLRFGVSNHSSHTWHWFQPAYHHDIEGPLAGIPYDAATLTKADGKGTWWDGLDPQDLYGGLRIPMSADLKTAKEAEAWHWDNDGHWYESIPPNDNGYAAKWFLRAQDLVDKYHPDLVYLDDEELPLGHWGLDFAAHYYNASVAAHAGKLDAVLFAKKMTPAHAPAVTPDIERGVSEAIRPEPWQTDTCISSWHYDRRIFDEHKYKTVGQVVRMLCDIVSKNGNLLLSVPVRGNGELDADEVAFLEGMAKWMDVNSEAIYGTRPWKVYGEGPSTEEKHETGQFGGAKDVRSQPYTAEDMRFTTKAGELYAIVFAWPADHSVLIKSLAGKDTSAVTLLGYDGDLASSMEDGGLRVQLPDTAPGEHAFVLKISGLR